MHCLKRVGWGIGRQNVIIYRQGDPDKICYFSRSIPISKGTPKQFQKNWTLFMMASLIDNYYVMKGIN